MTGACSTHSWRAAVARCNTCSDRICAPCRAAITDATGSSLCIECAAEHEHAACTTKLSIWPWRRRTHMTVLPAPAVVDREWHNNEAPRRRRVSLPYRKVASHRSKPAAKSRPRRPQRA